jgi:integrase
MSRRKSVPSYRRHSSGKARVTINGRDYLLGKYDSPASHEQYGKLIAEWSGSDAQSAYGLTRKPTIAELLVAYLEFAQQYYGTGPSSDYLRAKPALRPLRDLYADLEAEQFGPDQYKAVRQVLIDKDQARTYINAQMKLILRCIKWGVGEGIVPVAVHETLRCVAPLKRGRCTARETEPVAPVAQEVVDQTLTVLPKVVADMVRVQLLVGCRPGEVCRLTPSMIDRSEKVWSADLRDHKTAYRDKSRTIFFGPQAQDILRPYLLRGPDDCLFRPCDSEAQRRAELAANRKTPANQGNRRGYSKRSRAGRKPKRQPGVAYSTGSYAQLISEVCKRNNIPHWFPNQLRHTRATDIRKKFGLEYASAVLGHSNLEITLTYAEQAKAKAAEVMA